MIRIYPYRNGSRSAQALARALPGRSLVILRGPRSRYVYRPGHTVINWGTGGIAAARDSRGNSIPFTLNQAAAVNIVSDKLRFFNHISQHEGVPSQSIPRFTTSIDEAAAWREQRADQVIVARHTLSGSGGAGIEIIEPGYEIPAAPLYVEYILKNRESRVHIFKGECIAFQDKRRRLDVADGRINWRVRNLEGGFTFAREDVLRDDNAISLARSCVEAVGLDFGAVDLVWNRHRGWYVLEINTAPGLEGSTVNDYADAITRSIELY